jgi:hypothetical protein
MRFLVYLFPYRRQERRVILLNQSQANFLTFLAADAYLVVTKLTFVNMTICELTI